jgi:hypothetical protein
MKNGIFEPGDKIVHMGGYEGYDKSNIYYLEKDQVCIVYKAGNGWLTILENDTALNPEYFKLLDPIEAAIKLLEEHGHKVTRVPKVPLSGTVWVEILLGSDGKPFPVVNLENKTKLSDALFGPVPIAMVKVNWKENSYDE